MLCCARILLEIGCPIFATPLFLRLGWETRTLPNRPPVDRIPMLAELRAENYAVIDHAIATFGPGLNLLTGETGAGKSILVDALALLLGGKGSGEVVRHGADKAALSCVFES